MKLWWIHGYSRNSSDFEPLRNQIPCLVESVTIGLPGHGNSSLPFAPQELPKLLNHLDSQIRSDDLVIGHSLGARIAMALRSDCRKIAISPPEASGFTKETRKELLTALDPRQVRGESKPMTTLLEWLAALQCFQTESNTQILVAENDLIACKKFCASRPAQMIRGTDHLSILSSHVTALAVLKEIHDLLESH